jgi:hypothetical protein
MCYSCWCSGHYRRSLALGCKGEVTQKKSSDIILLLLITSKIFIGPNGCVGASSSRDCYFTPANSFNSSYFESIRINGGLICLILF